LERGNDGAHAGRHILALTLFRVLKLNYLNSRIRKGNSALIKDINATRLMKKAASPYPSPVWPVKEG
jgi:hypothetical protein